MKDFQKWLGERGTTPAQITARQRVREILGETTSEPTDREKRKRWQEERNR
jgi:hypothetical protein